MEVAVIIVAEEKVSQGNNVAQEMSLWKGRQLLMEV
jgi:hypothetical protein